MNEDVVRFEVFRCEPLVMHRLRTLRSVHVAGLTVLAAAALMVTANWLQGTVAHPGAFGDDLRALLRRGEATGPADFPLLRDYATILQTTCWALSVGVLHRQWQLIERLVPTMRTSAIFRVDDPTEFDGAVRAANAAAARWAEPRHVLLRLGIAGVLAAAWVTVPRVTGVYATLTPMDQDGATWPDLAYQSWWAALEPDMALGFAVYFGLLVFGLYLVVTLNFVGAQVMVVFLTRLERIHYRLNRLNPDGYFGWDVPRQILWTIYFMVLLHMAVLSLAFVLIPLEGVMAWVLFVVLAAVLAFYPVYLVVPIVWLSSALRRHKTAVVASLAAEADTDPGGAGPSVAEARRQREIRAEIEAVQAMRTVPFRKVQIAGALALLATVVGLFQFGADLFRG